MTRSHVDPDSTSTQKIELNLDDRVSTSILRAVRIGQNPVIPGSMSILRTGLTSLSNPGALDTTSILRTGPTSLPNLGAQGSTSILRTGPTSLPNPPVSLPVGSNAAGSIAVLGAPRIVPTILSARTVNAPAAVNTLPVDRSTMLRLILMRESLVPPPTRTRYLQ